MKKNAPLHLDILDLGVRPFEAVWALQKDLVEKRMAQTISDTLLFVEHNPALITVGRRGTQSQWQGSSLPVLPVERGGGATYHGPGQIVGYPILYLSPSRPKLREVLCLLEKTMIGALAEFDVKASIKEGLTGVWVGEKKIASIGIAARKWVTYHGFALNYDPELRHFREISPCGLKGEQITSLREVLPGPLPPAISLKLSLSQHFVKNFGYGVFEFIEKSTELPQTAEIRSRQDGSHFYDVWHESRQFAKNCNRYE